MSDMSAENHEDTIYTDPKEGDFMYQREQNSQYCFAVPNLENVEDVSGLCRLCATTSQYVVSIFGAEGTQNNILEKIHKYLPIQISADDSLPKVLCYECMNTVIAWDELVECCQLTDAALQARLTSLSAAASAQPPLKADIPVHMPPSLDITNQTSKENTSVNRRISFKVYNKYLNLLRKSKTLKAVISAIRAYNYCTCTHKESFENTFQSIEWYLGENSNIKPKSVNATTEEGTTNRFHSQPISSYLEEGGEPNLTNVKPQQRKDTLDKKKQGIEWYAEDSPDVKSEKVNSDAEEIYSECFDCLPNTDYSDDDEKPLSSYVKLAQQEEGKNKEQVYKKFSKAFLNFATHITTEHFKGATTDSSDEEQMKLYDDLTERNKRKSKIDKVSLKAIWNAKTLSNGKSISNVHNAEKY